MTHMPVSGEPEQTGPFVPLPGPEVFCLRLGFAFVRPASSSVQTAISLKLRASSCFQPQPIRQPRPRPASSPVSFDWDMRSSVAKCLPSAFCSRRFAMRFLDASLLLLLRLLSCRCVSGSPSFGSLV